MSIMRTAARRAAARRAVARRAAAWPERSDPDDLDPYLDSSGVDRAIAARAAVVRWTVAVAATLGLAGFGLVACTEPDGFDPAQTAEQGIRAQIQSELRLESTVECADPGSTAIGTTFTCDATDEEGKVYRFVAEIIDEELIGTRLD